MKCEESEKIIYLYKESTDQERTGLEEHIKSCKACALLFSQMQKVNDLIGEAHQETPVIENAAALTRRVMSSIKHKESLTESLLRLFDISVVRYAMALASVTLIILFVTEVRETGQPLIVRSDLPSKSEGIVLNSSAFRKDYMVQRERRASLFDCPKQWNDKLYISCLKEKIEKLSF